jgi:hypothetical protein
MPEVYNANSNSSKNLNKSGGHKVGRKRKRKSTEYSEVMQQQSPTRNVLATFAVRPPGVRFETQDKEEEVLLLLRRHIITNVGWFLTFILMLLAPLALSFFPLFTFMPERFTFISIVVWYLLAIGYGLERFLSWYFNVYIITDERIIDIDFPNLIYKEEATTKIENIEDVTVKMGGALRSALNFGSIFIQTAGESREFDFEDVPKPHVVTKFLNEMILEEEKEHMEGRVS